MNTPREIGSYTQVRTETAMTTEEAIAGELQDMSEAKRREVLEFVRRLKSAGEDSAFECALASEAVLAEDWLSPEQDEAWRDLSEV